MDSAHAELLASEAWRNICDTFFLCVCVVAGVTAGCSCRWEAGPLCPTASPRRLSEWVARLVRLPEYFTVALQVTAHLYGRISAVMLDSFWDSAWYFWVFLILSNYVTTTTLSCANKPASFSPIQAVWTSKTSLFGCADFGWLLNEHALLASEINGTLQSPRSGFLALHLLAATKCQQLRERKKKQQDRERNRDIDVHIEEDSPPLKWCQICLLIYLFCW